MRLIFSYWLNLEIRLILTCLHIIFAIAHNTVLITKLVCYFRISNLNLKSVYLMFIDRPRNIKHIPTVWNVNVLTEMKFTL